MKKSTKFFDAICFGIGSFLTVFFLFIFTLEGLIGLGCYRPIYYPLLQKLGIGVGVCLNLHRASKEILEKTYFTL